MGEALPFVFRLARIPGWENLPYNPHRVCRAQTTSSPPFFLRDSRASETRARVKIAPREKRRQAACRLFSHARSRFARSTIPEEKWGTTRSLAEPNRYANHANSKIGKWRDKLNW